MDGSGIMASAAMPVGETNRFGLGAGWQASPKLNMVFSYELAYFGDLSVNQNRGPLAGAVVGKFPNTFMNFFKVSFIWRSGSRGESGIVKPVRNGYRSVLRHHVSQEERSWWNTITLTSFLAQS